MAFLVGSARAVHALFVRSDTVYRHLGLECWDEARDARTYVPGDAALICHPPCRTWGIVRHFRGARQRPEERALGPLAVDMVRRAGGVLEHPFQSALWPFCGLPQPGGVRDAWGGFTLLVDQGWWGHPAPKPTYLYVVGCEPADVPAMPVQLQRAAGRTLELPAAERERTPELFARWLVQLAGITRRGSYTHLAVTPDQDQLHRSIAGGALRRPRGRRPVEVKAAMGQLAESKRAAFRRWVESQ